MNSYKTTDKFAIETLARLRRTRAFYKRPSRIQKLCKRAKSPDYYDFCLRSANTPGLWLEFGVADGKTIVQFARRTSEVVYGFYSFEGLPEDWRTSEGEIEMTKGAFTQGGVVPEVAVGNVEFIKGWFNDTLPGFLRGKEHNCSVVHVDCDLYSSACFVLDQLAARIVPGTLLLFDEIHGSPACEFNELRAFAEFASRTGTVVDWLAHVRDAHQAAGVVRLTEHPHRGRPTQTSACLNRR